MLRKIGEAVLLILAALLVIATVLPLFHYDAWWIRVFDFPRLQIFVIGLVVLIGYSLPPGRWNVASSLLMGGLLLSVLYQGYRIYPYTALAPEEVLRAPTRAPDSSLTVLVANVLMENRNDAAFLEIVRRNDPDVILTLETDAWWERRLRALDEAYPYQVKVPQDNTYGMLLHSRLTLVDAEVRFLTDPTVPSVHAQVLLPSGVRVHLHGLHPRPPVPREKTRTTDRDAALLTVGRWAKRQQDPVLVVGDLNDVAWSYTTRLFRKVSGLLDPRIGRGMYNTFPVSMPLMRWPIDHVFVSDHFELVTLKCLPAWGSDHFPMLVKVQFRPGAVFRQDAPEAEPEDLEQAREKIEKAR